MNYYKKNIQILKKLNPKLVDAIEEEQKPDWIQETTFNNVNNFLIKKNSKIIRAYPDKFDFEKITTKNFPDENATIIIGCGYGHLLNDILQKKEKKHIFIVYEKYTYFIKKSLELYDFSEQITNGELLFACPGKHELSYIMLYIEAKKVVQAWSLLCEEYILHLPEEYTDHLLFATEKINQIQCNVGTVMAAGKTIAINDIKNLPYVFNCRGVNEVKNLFTNKPAVLVSTGPSLQKNIHHLIENQDKVIIIAVAQALRILLAYDITPDFICTVDYGKTNMEHFKGLMHNQIKIPIVAHNRTFAGILQKYKGPKFITVSNGTVINDDTITGVLGKKGSLIQGGSVSHLNLGLALHLGCNPIALIGQDLAFEGNLSHSPLADANGTLQVNNGILEWYVTDPKSNLYGKKSIMGVPQKVNGFFNDPVITNIGLKSFITSFETIATEHKNVQLYNCTEGGADLKGFKKLALSDFLNNKKRINKLLKKELLTELPNKKTNALNIIKLLKNEIKDLQNLLIFCKKGIYTASIILTAKTKKERINAIEKNAEFSNKAEEITKRNAIITLSIYATSREIQSAKYKAKETQKDLMNSEKDREIRVERNKLILKTVMKTTKELLPIYKNTLKILNEYIKTNNEDLFYKDEDYEIDFDKIEEYLKVNNWAHPLVDLTKTNFFTFGNDISKYLDVCNKLKKEAIEKAIEQEKKERRIDIIKYNYLIEESRKLGKDKNFKESIKCIDKAIKLFPDKFAAKWGKASIYNFLNKLDASIELYDELIKDYPNNHRFKFEQAQVYLKKNINFGFQKMKEIFELTEEYDYFLLYLGHMKKHEKKYQDAINFYKEYLNKFPYNPEAWKSKADCHRQLHQRNEFNICFDEYNKLTNKI